MRAYSLTHLSDSVLLRDLAALVAQDRATSATLLAHIAEVDARKLYVPAGHSSMFMYCVLVLHLSEEVAYKRIQAARAARQFPEIYEFLADGRVHLSGVVMLAPYLDNANCAGLLSEATHKSKAEIEQLLANRFPRPDLASRIRALPVANIQSSLDVRTPGPDGGPSRETPVPGASATNAEPAGATPDLSGQLDPDPVASSRPPKVTPLAPRRFALQITISQEVRDNLRYAQELLSHRIPSGDLAEVLDCALKALVAQLERSKFGSTEPPRRDPLPSRPGKRYIPFGVRRAVWKRDQGCCTYVSEAGERCSARRFLEFDHVNEFARGGEATVENLRLRCRAHNQYEAELSFGSGFMRSRREAGLRSRRRADASTMDQSQLDLDPVENT